MKLTLTQQKRYNQLVELYKELGECPTNEQIKEYWGLGMNSLSATRKMLEILKASGAVRTKYHRTMTFHYKE